MAAILPENGYNESAISPRASARARQAGRPGRPALNRTGRPHVEAAVIPAVVQLSGLSAPPRRAPQTGGAGDRRGMGFHRARRPGPVIFQRPLSPSAMVCSSQRANWLAHWGTGEPSGPRARRLWVMAPEARMPILARAAPAMPPQLPQLGRGEAGRDGDLHQGSSLSGSIRERGDQTP